MQTYKVTRKFTGGTLKGLTHTGVTSVYMPLGFKCSKPCACSPYVIVECVAV